MFSASPQANGGQDAFAHSWPWGSHETKLLRALAAAARKWWGPNFDPGDISTAPRNEDVASWLQEKHGVGKTMAEKMATILRPDGLPTGPRP